MYFKSVTNILINLIINFSAFSLKQWKLNRGMTVGDALAYYDVSELLQSMEVSDLMRSEACRRSEAPYTGAGVNGWLDRK